MSKDPGEPQAPQPRPAQPPRPPPAPPAPIWPTQPAPGTPPVPAMPPPWAMPSPAPPTREAPSPVWPASPPQQGSRGPASAPPAPLWPAMTPPPSGPRRSGRALWLVLGAVALVLVIAGGAATVVLWPKSTSAPLAAGPSLAATSAAAAGAPAATTAPPLSSTIYHGVADLCATVDVTPLTELYPKQTSTDHTSTTTNMNCHAGLQSETVSGLLNVEARLLPDATATQVMYEGLRKATQRTDVVIEIPGLGTGAYWHLDPVLGTEVVAYDGNLYITALWGDLRDPAKTAPDIVMRLTALVRNTMTRLKAG